MDERMKKVMNQKSGKNWAMYHGDCCEVVQGVSDESVGFSIFSPPFSSLYVYSNSENDMGNSRSDAQFMEHFKFLIGELYRVTKPGREVAFHCANVPAMKERDGYIGLKHLRGALIDAFIAGGFIFHSEHVIWKDPLIEATRTKSIGLMHKQLLKDSTRCRAGIPDYLIAMRKPGENKEPVSHENGLINFIGDNPPVGGVLSHEIWRRYASPVWRDIVTNFDEIVPTLNPKQLEVFTQIIKYQFDFNDKSSPVWMDINQSNTLQKTSAREEKDERHICPLQLGVIERALHLWSNEGDVVLSPFAGIGSEGYQSLKMGRKFVGVELKESYFAQAVANLQAVENDSQSSLM